MYGGFRPVLSQKTNGEKYGMITKATSIAPSAWPPGTMPSWI
jgi:hypothetical protein